MFRSDSPTFYYKNMKLCTFVTVTTTLLNLTEIIWIHIIRPIIIIRKNVLRQFSFFLKYWYYLYCNIYKNISRDCKLCGARERIDESVGGERQSTWEHACLPPPALVFSRQSWCTPRHTICCFVRYTQFQHMDHQAKAFINVVILF